MKRFFHKKWKLPLWASWLIVGLLAVATFFIVAALNPSDYTAFYFQNLGVYRSLVVLNLAPIFWVFAVLYALSRRAVFSGLTGMAIFSIMAGINMAKVSLRDDPFIPQDITLVREMLSILDNYDFGGVFLIVLALLLLILLLVVLYLKFSPDRLRWYMSAAIIVLVAIMAGSFYGAYYQDYDRYKMYPYLVGGKATEYGCKGFVYSFIYDMALMQVDEPEGYDPALYAELEAEGDDPALYEDAVKPHVIMIMAEAFSLVSEEEVFDFTGHTDPLKHYKEIAEESVLSGSLLVDASGGGTVFTEFASLTGISPSTLNSISPYDYVRTDIDSLPRQLAKIGYENFAVHPGHSWFYNRENVYEYLGFSQFYNRENAFDESQSKGGYISEEATIDKVIELFQEHLDTSDSPLFEFCVTIQNHGGYGSKYGLTSGANFNTDADYSRDEMNILTDYFYGLQDADEELARLVEYLQTVDEPVVLVYYGDHVPSLTMDVYSKMGYNTGEDLESFISLYTAPFLIWQNDAAAETGVLTENLAETELYDGIQMSAYYLGTTLMELLGFDGLSPFYSYTNALRASVPAMRWGIYRDSSGTLVEEVPEGADYALNRFHGWGYYKLFEEIVT